MCPPKDRLEQFPAVNRDNFKCFHEQPIIFPIQKNNVQKESIYSTLPDAPLEQRIVNERKPQVTLRYLTVKNAGGAEQYSLQSSQKATHLVKKRKLSTGSKTT